MAFAALYPYQNLSLDDLPDEKWKAIEGFEDRYEISSYGRVKTLSWERIAHHGSSQKMNEKIRKLKVNTTENKHMNDLLYSIIITLRLDGKIRHFSVGRLVYNAFVEPFDLTDHSLFISYKDGDGRNLHYQNLFMTTLAEMSSHSYSTGRALSHLSLLSKPVGQFDTSGKLINQFDSMAQAAKATGFGPRRIVKVANGQGYLSNGYCWQLGKGKTLKPETLPLKEETLQVNRNLMAKLGIKHITHPTPAVFDLTLKNRPGEQWKNFPGYEGLYEISNHGRIKALKKVSEGKLRKWYPEKIRYPSMEISQRGSGTLKPGTASISLCKNRQKKSYCIARWVYHLFVKPFDIANSAFRVYYKDSNNLNMAADNLELHNAVYSIKSKAKT